MLAEYTSSTGPITISISLKSLSEESLWNRVTFFTPNASVTLAAISGEEFAADSVTGSCSMTGRAVSTTVKEFGAMGASLVG